MRDPQLAAIATLEPLEGPDRPRVGLCVIASNTSRHLDDYTRFSESADVLLIEKPISSSLESLRGFDITPPTTKVSVSAPLRFLEGFGAVQSQLGTLGVITGVNVESRSWLPSWRPGTNFRGSYSADAKHGGVLLDLVHEIDYCLLLFGAPVTLSATLSHRSVLDIASESTAHMLWGYGAYELHMVLDYVSRPPSRSLTIFGTLGSLRWDLLKASVAWRYHDEGRAEMASFPDDLNRDIVLVRQICAIAEGGSDLRLSSLTQAWQAVAVCDLAKESSRNLSVTLDASEALDVNHAE